MEEELIRRQCMQTAGDLAEEEKMIIEIGKAQEIDMTIVTHFLTLMCC